MRNFFAVLLLGSLILCGMSGCQSPQKPPLPPTLPPPAPTATPFPTPAASISGDALTERLALRVQTQPQAGKIANNRVEALVQIHEFTESYLTALEDSSITFEELVGVIQLAVNARASLYNTGEPDMILVANTSGWLVDLAVYGDWEAAESSINRFQRSLPRKPSLD